MNDEGKKLPGCIKTDYTGEGIRLTLPLGDLLDLALETESHGSILDGILASEGFRKYVVEHIAEWTHMLGENEREIIQEKLARRYDERRLGRISSELRSIECEVAHGIELWNWADRLATMLREHLEDGNSLDTQVRGIKAALEQAKMLEHKTRPNWFGSDLTRTGGVVWNEAQPRWAALIAERLGLNEKPEPKLPDDEDLAA